MSKKKYPYYEIRYENEEGKTCVHKQKFNTLREAKKYRDEQLGDSPIYYKWLFKNLLIYRVISKRKSELCY
jgi:hypothetical protein